jgi:hypothetical protein
MERGECSHRPCCAEWEELYIELQLKRNIALASTAPKKDAMNAT